MLRMGQSLDVTYGQKKITPTQERYNAMNYEQSIDYIHSIPKFRRPLGNANLEKLLTHLDNPQKKLKFIHIAGTNGKGSTAAMTAEILKKSDFKTGLFTSPYLEVFNERIRITVKILQTMTLPNMLQE